MIELALAAWLQAASTRPSVSAEVGSKSCAGCHKAIYESYVKTGMARSSGRAGADFYRESFASSEFDDAPLGVKYLVSTGVGAYKMEFAREATGVRGERALQWFVGSGNVGRSYLFAQNRDDASGDAFGSHESGRGAIPGGAKVLAERTLERILAFHPNLGTARKLLGEMRGQ